MAITMDTMGDPGFPPRSGRRGCALFWMPHGATLIFNVMTAVTLLSVVAVAWWGYANLVSCPLF